MRGGRCEGRSGWPLTVRCWARRRGRRAHPALVEARQQRIALARLLAALRLPAGEEEAGDRRPQRRMGVRGVYGVGGVA